jgi:hypothetical protein
LKIYVSLVCFTVCVCGGAVIPAKAQSAIAAPNSGPQQPSESATGDESTKEKAEQQLKQQERQRILGIIPEFNTSNIPDAVPLTPKQKFSLALKSALDPAAIAFAGIDAGWAQLDNSYKGYGQGAQGYFKRFGAAYADGFDGTILGNAVFPALLHQDPRYFRKGTGTVSSRFWYAVATTIRCKDDSGKWVPNYSNVLGNFAAGGVSNIYYPAEDRGGALTAERALTVTAEGALGALFYEFWPDISRKLFKKNR